jgi:hypothetical protein
MIATNYFSAEQSDKPTHRHVLNPGPFIFGQEQAPLDTAA